MTTQYTTILKLALPVQGELSGTWGDVVNDNITQMVEQAIAGKATIDSWTANAHTLTTADGTTAESRCAILELTDTGTALTGAGTVTCPTNTKLYIVDNNTAEIITVKTSGGTGVAVPVGKTMLVYCDGTNVVEGVTHANSLSLGTSTSTVNAIDTATDLGAGSSSNSNLPTQLAVKTYVDSQVGTVDTLSEILANGNTTGANDIDVENAQKVQFRDAAIYVNSSADGQLDLVADTEIQIAATTVDINGNLDVSGTTVSAGKITADAGIDIDNINIDGTTIALSSGDLTLDVAGDIILDADGGDVFLRDAGSEFGRFQGSSQDFLIRNDTQDKDISIVGNDGGVTVTALAFDMSEAGAATFNAGATFGGNVDVTGTVTADGLTVNSGAGDLTASFQSTDQFADLKLTDSGGSSYIRQSNGSLLLQADRDNASSNSIVQVSVDGVQTARFSSGGDISFYEDTGTTPKFFWDASAESLGIGTSSAAAKIHIQNDSDTDYTAANFCTAPSAIISNTTSGALNYASLLFSTEANGEFSIGSVQNSGNTASDFVFASRASGTRTERLRIDGTTGNVGIGTSTATSIQGFAKVLKVEDAGSTSIVVSGDVHEAEYAVSANGGWFGTSTNIPQRFVTNNTERMRIDASGNVLVGKTSSDTNVEGSVLFADSSSGAAGAFTSDGIRTIIANRKTSDGEIISIRKDGTAVGSIGTNGGRLSIGSGDVNLNFNASANSIYPISDTAGTLSDGIVDVGASTARFKDLYLSSIANIGTYLRFGGASNYYVHSDNANYLRFGSNGSEVARFDNSGNLLVGKTTNEYASNAGHVLRNDGLISSVRSGGNVCNFNRLSSDGEVIQLNKDGVRFGSIGNIEDILYIATDDTTDCGIRFDGDNQEIVPCSSTGARVDGTIDLGDGSGRFKDLYLSGSVIAGDISDSAGVTKIGGTDTNYIQMVTNVASANPRLEPSVDNTIDLGRTALRFTDIYATNGTIQTSDRNEKQDIEELSDAEQRVAVAAKGLLRKFRWKSSVAENGDDARTHFGIIAQDLQAAFAAEGLDAGDYAMFINSTWTDEETGEERTRLGVRYHELLAFIIAAI